MSNMQIKFCRMEGAQHRKNEEIQNKIRGIHNTDFIQHR